MKDEYIDITTNRILVLGNGFDIANNFDTRYSDYIKFIKEKKYDKYSKNSQYKKFIRATCKNHFINHFCSVEMELWVDVETEIHRIINSIEKLFSEKKIMKLRSKLMGKEEQLQWDYRHLMKSFLESLD